jgi:anaphase-promoting complex subunit 6
MSRDGKTILRIDRTEDRQREDVATVRAEAAMCYLRGLCHAKQNAFDRAKECYKDAVRIDVQCFEAFDALMKNSLMQPSEEWDFLNSLDFDTIVVGDGRDPSESQEAAQFTKLLYTTRLGKYGHAEDFASATETLSTHYKLSNNPDIALSKASHFFTQCRFREALELTTAILDQDPHNFPTMPVHLACLYELGQKNLLYLLSHKLADTHPDEPCTYLAIGIYYLSINQIASARRFFSKASILDPHFGPAWIGFAHTFAHEGEHDQAISAYSTATRLFQGTHLPNLFLGMQNLQLGNLRLAKDYLLVAYKLCMDDPLLLNELGVCFYQDGELGHAIGAFEQALKVAEKVGSSPSAWISTRANLGHARRRLGQLPAALEEFDQVLREGGKDAATFSAKGLVLMEMGRIREATIALHEALALSPQDPVATDLLTRAMEDFEDTPVMDEVEEREFERRIGEIASLRGRRGRVRRLRGQGVHGEAGPSLQLEGESMLVDEDEDA